MCGDKRSASKNTCNVDARPRTWCRAVAVYDSAILLPTQMCSVRPVYVPGLTGVRWTLQATVHGAAPGLTRLPTTIHAQVAPRGSEMRRRTQTRCMQRLMSTPHSHHPGGGEVPRTMPSFGLVSVIPHSSGSSQSRLGNYRRKGAGARSAHPGQVTAARPEAGGPLLRDEHHQRISCSSCHLSITLFSFSSSQS